MPGWTSRGFRLMAEGEGAGSQLMARSKGSMAVFEGSRKT